MKQKEYGITAIFACMSGLILIIMAFFVMETGKAESYVEWQRQVEENRRLCERESQALADGSDYLTNEVWHFAATQDVTHLKNYWTEVNESRERDIAIEHLLAQSLTGEEEALLKDAKRESDRLIRSEAWAMRLIADSMGIPGEELPGGLGDIVYENGEEKLTPEEKREVASRYIFGGSYSASKEKIKGSILAFRTLLRERKNDEVAACVTRTQSALNMVRLLVLAMIAVFVLEGALFYSFIIRPFYYYMRMLAPGKEESFTALTPMGTRETREFARVFNRIYARWQKERRHLEEERYRFHTALENTSVVIYEYDPVTDTCTAYGTLEQIAGDQEEGKQEWSVGRFRERFIPSIMDQVDADLIQRAIDEKWEGPVELKIHPVSSASHTIWIQITGKPIYNENRELIKIIGKISNIQAEKELESALKDAQNRDGLTGLLKREAGVRSAREYMAAKPSGEVCCIMLMDMDEFGRINEEEGQAFADAVLQDVADILKNHTQADDILVRMGGDEFMICIKNCSKARAGIVGPEIAAAISGLTAQYNTRFEISASIGMCVSEVVNEYSGLYRCAESTLNFVKEQNRGHAACYLDSSNEMGMFLTQMYPDEHYVNEIERSEAAREDLPSFALNLLGKSKNLDDAVFLLLSRAGKVIGLDRILIMQVDKEYMASRVVYQWARTREDTQTTNVIYFSEETLREISQSYDSQGLCERRIITGPCEMKSLLHAAIWNYGECAGAMSFERREEQPWTGQERALLSELTRIIASFLLKARADAVSQAKTDFLSRMSHEIRTPMNAISGMTVIAKTALHDPERTMDCLNKIESANRYLMSLINDVLDMSRIESGRLEIHREAVSLDRLAGNIDTLIRPQAEEKQLKFVIQNGFQENTTVMADELRLNQVLVNLLGNAVKFTDAGGTVTLVMRPEGDSCKGGPAEQPADSGPKKPYDSGARPGQTVRMYVCVSDTGIGISEEARSRIFNAFEQERGDTVSRYGGSGLGLAISRHLVQLMGGSLEVESEQGKGSSFYFTIPMAYADSAGQNEAPALGEEEDPFDPHEKRLLLVEDNQLNREIAQEILSMHGFTVETAENGKEAVDLFESHDPGYYDAILMDIRMPVMGGMEATRRIRTMEKADSRPVPIIAMTANAFDEDMRKSLENGMDGHLSKPVDVDRLLKILCRLIHAREHGHADEPDERQQKSEK